MLFRERRIYLFQKLQIKEIKKQEDSLSLRYNKEFTSKSQKVAVINASYARYLVIQTQIKYRQIKIMINFEVTENYIFLIYVT